jgi:hypothetical protein
MGVTCSPCWSPSPLSLEDGLPVTTILFGAYDKKTGRPLAGLINQPFSVYHPTEEPPPATSSPVMIRRGSYVTSHRFRRQNTFHGEKHQQYDGFCYWGVTKRNGNPGYTNAQQSPTVRLPASLCVFYWSRLNGGFGACFV